VEGAGGGVAEEGPAEGEMVVHGQADANTAWGGGGP
jgi:hypothetical protein